MAAQIISFNANGLRDGAKLQKAIVALKGDIICFQETHWTDEMMNDVQKIWDGYVFVSHGSVRSCGVAILVKNGFKEVKETYRDDDGRVIGIDLNIDNVMVSLFNIYAPNIEKDRRTFFSDLKLLCKDNSIVVGDFNTKCTMLDVMHPDNFKYDYSREMLLELMKENDMVDSWRVENPQNKGVL